MSFSVDLSSLDVLKKSQGLGKEGRIQRYIDQEVIRHMALFTPFGTGALQNSAYGKNGEVIYTVIDARENMARYQIQCRLLYFEKGVKEL
jgi:hypothetical protein